jgi:hypothetical protein
LEHFEFLQEELSDPARRVAELLDEHIDPQGSVVVWYAPFERGVNEEIAKKRPEYAHVMERINGQIVDLRDIFSDQHYVHPGFRGSTSIKAVLPVLCPELSYEGLAIKEGATASEQWWEMVSGARSSQKRGKLDTRFGHTANSIRMRCMRYGDFYRITASVVGTLSG